MNELGITGKLFRHENISMATWVSPDGITRNQIDYVLIYKRFNNSVKHTRVCRSADIGSDHYLVRTTVKLGLNLWNQTKNRKELELSTIRPSRKMKTS